MMGSFQRARLLPVVALSALLAVALLVAQGVRDGKEWRTSAPGYSDTPLLPNQHWRVHDIRRPHPPIVTPGAQPGDPPSDAIVLFDGKDFSHWLEQTRDGLIPPRWKLENGYMEATHNTGSILTKEKFGDCQLHVEWAAPAEIDGDGQWRGNSGVLLMNRYEIQVLDSWNNVTYADGQAAAIYGQFPPLVNASRKPGQWQSYDIVFEAPQFDASGKLLKPAYVTVFHNGVLVHHHQEIIGPMAHRIVRKYEPHGAEEPLGLQNHDTKVRYRNIWIRRLKGYDQP